MSGNITVNNYATMQLHAEVTDGTSQKAVLHASYRQDRHLNLQVEVLDAPYTAANREAVTEAVLTFIREACDAAAAAGLPTAMT